jgi:hypothetical protein
MRRLSGRRTGGLVRLQAERTTLLGRRRQTEAGGGHACNNAERLTLMLDAGYQRLDADCLVLSIVRWEAARCRQQEVSERARGASVVVLRSVERLKEEVTNCG